jgi:MspA
LLTAEDNLTPTRVRCGALALAAALFTAAAALGSGPAPADPASSDPLADVPPPPPAIVPGASSPPATGTSADGWTLTLSANSESMTPAAPLDLTLATRDFIVGGLFNGTLRGPNQKTTPTPSGTLEVGYQIQCVPSGMLAAALKPAVTQVQVLKQDYKRADPSATVTAFRVQVDCLGPALIRSYAILTRTTYGTNAVVAYYGVSTPG